MSSDEQPPSVPSDPYDELFSLAYRFRCPGNFLPVLGDLELTPLRCGTKTTPAPARIIKVQCTLIKFTDIPFPTGKLCSTKHFAKPTSFVRRRMFCTEGVKRFTTTFPTGKLCGNRRWSVNRSFTRYHAWYHCKTFPSNTEWPMQRHKCGASHVSLAIKLLRLNQKRSTIGCRVYDRPEDYYAFRGRCTTITSKYKPPLQVVHASFLCYSSEKILGAGGARLAQHVFICPKSFRSTIIAPVILGHSLSCNVFPIVEQQPAVKTCQIIKNVVGADGKTPLRPQIHAYGANCRTYPVGFVVGDVLQGNRMCGTRPALQRADHTFPNQVRPHTGMICRLFPLGSEFTVKRSRCGTIWLANAPILIFGRVWGGVSPIFLPPTSGRVGGAFQRYK